MEDDDEFGDLYTDVLRPLTTSFHQQQSTPAQSAATPSQNFAIDLNIESEDEEILFGGPNSNPNVNPSISSQQSGKAIALESGKPQERADIGSDVTRSSNSDRNLCGEANIETGLAGPLNVVDESDSKSRVLESGDDVIAQQNAFGDLGYMDEANIDVVVEERDDNDVVFGGKDAHLVGGGGNFDIEDVEAEIGGIGSDPMIPGLSIPGVSAVADNPGNANFEEDWGSDSDSEDDLRIVLNENDHGPTGMERIGGGGDDDDDDEDGEPLVIVAGSDNLNHQPLDEQDWGEDAAQGPDGERKELGDGAKVNGVAVAPKIGYNNHAYHPFNSQFKYVRPGAAPIPGAAPVGSVGAPGQVRPPINMASIAGRGRGDWRPTGIKSALPMQKGFHPGYGMPWGNNAAGRGFGSGLEFTLPSYKTIFEVDIDSFEEKPWKLPGIDLSDYFNFGLNEDSWKDYSKQLEQLRLEGTMQSRIRVYESGRTEQDYDPDLPPELAAAAGILDVPSENANVGKSDAGQIDLSKGSGRVRPPLPTGRAIQVESGYGERLPSIDSRPPRIRDSDSIIEIFLQGSAGDDSYPVNDNAEGTENDPARENRRGDDEAEVDIAPEHFDDYPLGYDGRKREPVGRRSQFINPLLDNIAGIDENMPSPPEAHTQFRADSRNNNAEYRGRNFGIPHEERRTNGREHGRAPNMTLAEVVPDNKEEIIESLDGEASPNSASPVANRTFRGQVVEDKDMAHDELVQADEISEKGREGMDLDSFTMKDNLKGEKLMHSVNKEQISGQAEQTSPQEVGDAEDSKTARSSDNSKVRSGSSRDYRKSRDDFEEEVVQGGHSMRMGSSKRPVGDEDSFRRRGHVERQEMERHHMSVKGRDDIYSRKYRDPNSVHHLHMKTDVDRRKESDNSDGAWQWRDEDPYARRSRADNTRKRERSDEMGSRHRNKVRENERSDKGEHHELRTQLENGSRRAHHDRDMGSRNRDRDDSLKSRTENPDDLRSKRKKDEVQLRRDYAEKEEYLHVQRDNSSRRKRERDDVLDQRKRDDQTRVRDDDQHYGRHKEEAYLHREKAERQREREEWHRLKQSHEESLSKREREEGWGGARSGRAVEDKALASRSRVKNEYKGSDRDYHSKETARESEQLKRRDQVENESPPQHRGREVGYTRGIQAVNDEKRARRERSSTRNDRAVSASDTHRVHEKKHKEDTRRSKEAEDGDQNSVAVSKRNQEEHSGQMSETVRTKAGARKGNGDHEIHHSSSRKHKEDASSEDEQQDSSRGRSKLERWTSHKERDFTLSTKSSSSSSSLKAKDGSTFNNESSINEETLETQQNSPSEKEKDGDVKPVDDKHLDTVAKLKKRSERFKLPLPSEKEVVAIKKMENEPLPSVPNETLADSEIKPERPARKRRWTSN